MNYIRKARTEDSSRIAEIEVFNYRLNFYPIFQDDGFYFAEFQVTARMKEHEKRLSNYWVYDDGVVKGFIHVEGKEVKKLFVEPILQGKSVPSRVMRK